MKIYQESWTSIKDYEGLYEISELGSARSLDRYVSQIGRTGKLFTRIYRGRVLKIRASKNLYSYIQLSKDGVRKTVKIHQLLALNFIPNPYDKPEVNRKDGIKRNNKYINLEWVTSSENKHHALRTGLKKNPFGKNAHSYKGRILVYKNGILIDYLEGDRDIALKGCTSCGVSSVITGHQTTHRKCTFTREKRNG